MRKKFVILVMVFVLLLIFIAFTAISLIQNIELNKNTIKALKFIQNNRERLTEVLPNQTHESLLDRFFIVDLDKNGNITHILLEYSDFITEDYALHIIEAAINSPTQTGYIDNYEYLKNNTNTEIIFLDRSLLKNVNRITINISFIVVTIVFFSVLIIVALASSIAVKPFVENSEEQKKFITNVSHELKTPLAIISANMDVLELTLGENEWLDSTKNQVTRLNEMIKELMTMSKLSEGDRIKHNLRTFNLSVLLHESIATFKELANAKGHTITYTIQDSVMYTGNADYIERVVAILIDNAIKYTPDSEAIIIELTVNRNKKIITVKNKCDNLEKDDLKRMFQRFYRKDKARTQKNSGYGIGLSLADTIVKAHGGKIHASMDKESLLTFTVIL